MSGNPYRFTIFKSEARHHGPKGGRARAIKFGHAIDGKMYTTGEVARRLGVSDKVAMTRLRRSRFPITWDQLGGSHEHT